MRKLAPILVALFSCYFSTAQVGINTTEPSSTLDVNGTIRIRSLSEEPENGELEYVAERIVGIDENGNFVPVEMGDNVVLEDNKLRAVDNVAKIGDIPTLGLSTINNLSLIILPGEPNEDKSVIKIRSLLGNSIITGLQAGQDGQQIYLYPVDGDMQLVNNSILSLFANRLQLTSGVINVKQYEMIRLMYDAEIQKWVVMNKE
ncbi:MAG: hypothetical protein CL596_10040 [Alteromonas sp.]|nr:hypothetical protein [Alteromonas sp.]MAY21547.1 hypothetical protein [Flavobacteriaceae bacterium]|tara:strand:- start:46796 stop:47404 length:609 start_codon:yes stop_codon:yes gene_type:complete